MWVILKCDEMKVRQFQGNVSSERRTTKIIFRIGTVSKKSIIYLFTNTQTKCSISIIIIRFRIIWSESWKIQILNLDLSENVLPWFGNIIWPDITLRYSTLARPCPILSRPHPRSLPSRLLWCFYNIFEGTDRQTETIPLVFMYIE